MNGTVNRGEAGGTHGGGEGSDGWEWQGRGWVCSGRRRAMPEAGAPCGAGERCSRISHLAGLTGVAVRVALYYFALQYSQGEREREETL